LDFDSMMSRIVRNTALTVAFIPGLPLTLREFRAVLAARRAQIDAKKPLPNLPGQAVYLARLKVMSTYKDLTDAVPARIGRGNKFGVPPAYFDADIEPLPARGAGDDVASRGDHVGGPPVLSGAATSA